MPGPLGQRLGPQPARGRGNLIGILHVVNEPLAVQFVAEQFKQGENGLLGTEHDPFVVDQGQPVAVAVEGQAQVRPLMIYGIAQFAEIFRPGTIRRQALEAAVGLVVDGRKNALWKDGVQIAPGLSRPTAVQGIERHVELRRERINEHLL